MKISQKYEVNLWVHQDFLKIIWVLYNPSMRWSHTCGHNLNSSNFVELNYMYIRYILGRSRQCSESTRLAEKLRLNLTNVSLVILFSFSVRNSNELLKQQSMIKDTHNPIGVVVNTVLNTTDKYRWNMTSSFQWDVWLKRNKAWSCQQMWL